MLNDLKQFVSNFGKTVKNGNGEKEFKAIDVRTAVKRDILCAIAMLNFIYKNSEIFEAIVAKMEKERDQVLQDIKDGKTTVEDVKAQMARNEKVAERNN